MPVSPRAVAANLIAHSPIHRVLPPGALKTYATVKYHGERSTPEAITTVVDSLGGIPTKYHSTAIVAARAAFRSGLDDQVRAALETLKDRFPESPDVLRLQADLHAHHNDFDTALQLVHRARLLDPSSAAAAAAAVRYSYHALDRNAADQYAARMVGRFPVSSGVLWAAAKACVSGEQYERIEAAWNSAVKRRTEPTDLLRAVRPLATAAARAHNVSRAIELFGKAITAVRHGVEPPEHSTTRLAGRGAWRAVQDICRMLDDAGIPFFFAAGTALGFERVGRPLSDDGDIDVGILEQDFDAERLTALVAEHPMFLIDPHPLSSKVHMRHRGGSPVDFFRYYTEDGKMWHDGVFVRWWNTPFEVERRRFNGLNIPLPTNPDRYLTENYANWRIPNADFDSFTDEAPNCTVHWEHYQQLHFMRRAFRAATAKDFATAAAELRSAGETALANRIGDTA